MSGGATRLVPYEAAIGAKGTRRRPDRPCVCVTRAAWTHSPPPRFWPASALLSMPAASTCETPLPNCRTRDQRGPVDQRAGGQVGAGWGAGGLAGAAGELGPVAGPGGLAPVAVAARLAGQQVKSARRLRGARAAHGHTASRAARGAQACRTQGSRMAHMTAVHLGCI